MAQTPAGPGDLAVGQRLFESQCALCHGQDGSGGRGPNLRRAKLNHAPDDAALHKVITDGIQPEMPGAWQLDSHEVASVAAYVRKIGQLPPNLSRAIPLAASISTRPMAALTVT